jgi:hypothetical protein
VFIVEINPMMKIQGVLTEVQSEAEEIVEHRAYNTTYTKRMTALKHIKSTGGLV